MYLKSLIALCAASILTSVARGDIIYSIDVDPVANGVQSSAAARVDELVIANVILDLTGSTSLSSYSIEVQYDASELDFLLASSSETAVNGLVSLLALEHPEAGRITGIEAVTLGLGPAGSNRFSIATLAFRARRPSGNSQDIDIAIVEDPLFGGSFDNDGLQLSPQFRGGSVTSVVPEPSSLVVLALAISMRIGRRLRSKIA